MLVLTRKIGQKLIISDNIEIVILETKDESVKIGIKAPKDITIYREEIYEEIKKANEQASSNALVTDIDKALNLLDPNKKKVNDYFSKFNATINIAKQDNKPNK
jgi:carbon storage regulator